MRKTPDRARKPTFYWQGLLIVFPAILLAGVGFFSLRQDRILAHHEATEQAKKVAGDLAQVLLPKSLHTESGTSDAVFHFHSAPNAPEEDPVLAHVRASDPKIACLLDDQGTLLYPPPQPPFPDPQHLDFDELDDQQRADWEAATSATFTGQDLQTAIDLHEQLLSDQPPQEFAAIASLRLAVLLARQGEDDRAWRMFGSIIENFPTAVGETGLPLRPFAELQLLQMAFRIPGSDGRRTGLLSSICARAVLEPSCVSRFILNKAKELETDLNSDGRDTSESSHAESNFPNTTASSIRSGSIGDRWLAVWKAHEHARALHALFRETIGKIDVHHASESRFFWLEFGDLTFLAHLQNLSGEMNQWLFAQPEARAARIVKEVLVAQRLASYLGVSVTIAGKSLASIDGTPETLATASFLAGDGSNPDLKVSVHLINPPLLYARQRTRTFLFGSLIGISAIAVLIGFFTAWRAFQTQQRLSEMKSNFVASVSHELRAPIASVRLMAEELEDIGPQDRQKNKEYHRFIVQECRRLSALIENVLDYSRHEQGRQQYEFEPTDMAALVRETAKLMQAYGLDKQINVSAVIHGQPVSVDADGRALQQVLVNLIDNAIKHSPSGSNVEIGLEFQKQEVVFWVEDQGEGIPPEEHQRIFERFYRRGTELRRETQGVGLGLAIVKYVTEAHHGKVTIRSAAGQGSRFTVTLPLDPDSEQ
jgi:signal transduction histidine kinase